MRRPSFVTAALNKLNIYEAGGRFRPFLVNHPNGSHKDLIGNLQSVCIRVSPPVVSTEEKKLWHIGPARSRLRDT